MTLYYIGDNDNEYGFKYGDEIDLFQDDIPKKPYEEYGSMICPNCGEIVTNDFSECENCGQALDWED